jgi:hypothetical protein
MSAHGRREGARTLLEQMIAWFKDQDTVDLKAAERLLLELK